MGGGFGVAFAGKSYAAVSAPHFLANSSYRITSLSLVRLLGSVLITIQEPLLNP